MKKIEKDRLASTKGGMNCFLAGVALGICFLSMNPYAIASGTLNAYNTGCM